MSIKRILVPLRGVLGNMGPLEAALELARLFEGHVEALYFRPDVRATLSRVMHGESAAVGDEFFREVIANAERVAREARARFEGVLATHGVALGDDPAAPQRPTATWREAPEYDVEALAHHSALIDLILVGRPGSPAEAAPGMLDAALFNTGRPVLVLPPAPTTRFTGTVLIGWNPTLQAERALIAALPFLRLAERSIVLAVATGAKRGPGAADAARYLAWHGIRAEAHEVEPGDRQVGEILLTQARTMEAGLLVMGAYSHSRLREMILGGVTRHVLEQAELPVLMAH